MILNRNPDEMHSYHHNGIYENEEQLVTVFDRMNVPTEVRQLFAKGNRPVDDLEPKSKPNRTANCVTHFIWRVPPDQKP